MTALHTALVIFGATYALWIFYLAVMSLDRARRAGQLAPIAKVFGYPVLWVGLALDLFVNVTLCTLLFLELPREMTVTARLKRHNSTAYGGWRQRLARWFEPLLDPFDPTGNHI